MARPQGVTVAFGLTAGGHHLRTSPCSLPLCGGHAMGGCCPYRQAVASRARKRRPLRAGLGHGLAVGGRPCIVTGRGWPTLLLAVFAVKMQQERVERFYVI
ncbi:hypothetical protein B296_00056627 [Ensete ventricosum]|uniref:Uncharacterized protein n=1 Tax=Ensete ventricosum TaxID=4639 RepID=A0A426WVK2_ENSVE|nr:hypothetical protein B296_00056627 [Ensete ventricosum]